MSDAANSFTPFFVEIMEELVVPDIRSSKFHGRFDRPSFRPSQQMMDNRNKKILGHGTQAAVKNDPNDPHMVKKYNFRTYSDFKTKTTDGFNDFINFLINNDFTDNIHFPKVYNVKTITDKEGERIHTYTMEKLIDSRNVSREEIEAFVEHHLNEDFFEMPSPEANDESFIFRALDRIAEVLHNGIRGYNNAIRSDTLKEAIHILQRASRALGKDSDMHVGNMMWRRSSTGVTLVITDPFF